ncbi:hypothetical protein PC110_g10242 [Phytophthora cactorum]|uniref:Uncharacterized protein n=1 Tax=Phytophthora cactorum TaxID=29920 RepID=A0A329S9R3_9STRA|nr:hypothetical protein PC110_g10242 [Phytophthora cactorum]
MMVNASTEDEYHTAHKYLYYVVEGKHTKMSEELPEPDHTFLKDFHNKVSNDVEYIGGGVVSFEGRVQMYNDSGRVLIYLRSIGEVESTKKITDVGYMRYRGGDSELQQLVKEVSQHAYQLVEEQYRVANDRKTHYVVRELHHHVYKLTSSIDSTLCITMIQRSIDVRARS